MKRVMVLAPEDMCDILQPVLDKTYKTLPCFDPVEAPGLLSGDPDILILDLFLPETDGLAFLKSNIDRLPPVVIVLTRYVDKDLLQTLVGLKVSAVLRIPFCRACLLEQLAKKHLP